MPSGLTICLNCSKPIKSGRSDKKFCDSICKDAYNNAIKSDDNKETRKIKLTINKNRKILKELFNPRKLEKLIAREDLIKAGFEFTYHTHHVITKTKSNEFTFCYDYGYREIEKDKFQIIKSFK